MTFKNALLFSPALMLLLFNLSAMGAAEVAGNENITATTPASKNAGKSSKEDNLQPPTYLSNPKPVYPELSRRLGEHGTVILSVYILADGSVGDAVVHWTSRFPRLDNAAVDAVKAWKFIPARTSSGDYIDKWVEVSIHFDFVRPTTY